MRMSALGRRRLELDLLRTLAIACMVLYHLVYDLSVLYGWEIDPFTGGWRLLARATASLFLLVSGMSVALASARHDRDVPWGRRVRRAAQIGAAAMLVTAVTYAALGDTYVRFGILHLVAVSGLLLPLFLRLGRWNVLAGALWIAAGRAISGLRADTRLLLPLGIRPAGFASVDYFPLLPWFGVVLLGAGLAALVYAPGRAVPSPRGRLWEILSIPGRRSLTIYLLHQPVLLGILYGLYGPWH